MPIRMIFSLIFLVVFLVAVCIKQVGGTGDYKPVPVRKYSFIALGLSLLFMALASVRVIHPGQVGIPVAFGNAGQPIGSGVHLVNPFASIERMSVRTETYTMSATQGEGQRDGDDSVSVLGSDGGSAGVDATLLFHLERPSAADVYNELGTGFVEKVVRPTARTCIRDGFAGTEMVDAATTSRETVAASIQTCIERVLSPHGITVEQFQLREIHLSEALQASVDAKVTAQQRAEQQEFELQTTRQQAEIARVDAQGRADAQQIIACGGHTVVGEDGAAQVVPNTGDSCQNTLTPEYLQYLYIQSLEQIAASDTNSTIILPFDQELTPLLNVPSAG